MKQGDNQVTYSDEQIARQLEDLLHIIQQERDSANQVLQQAQTIQEQARTQFQQIDDSLPAFGQELQRRLARANELASQTANDRNTVSQLAQQTEDKANQILQVQSVIQQLHQELVSVVNEIGGTQSLEQLRQEYQAVRHTLSETLQANQQLRNEAEQQLNALQTHAAITHRRFNEIQELISTTQSALVTQAISQVEEVQRRVQLQEEQVLTQLRTMVAATLTQLGGQAGLERLRQELQEGHQVLGEI